MYLFRPLCNHDFRVMFIARFLMQMGILTVQEYLTYFLKDAVGRPYTFLGYVVGKDEKEAVSVLFLPMLVASLISACLAGVYADRTGKRKVAIHTAAATSNHQPSNYHHHHHPSLLLYPPYRALQQIRWWCT
mmetsp:Transcript_26593/g.44630  ORF Transcript_26593/g.44630 Transcript_26593/m.44630 type:complete len:132 (-) Transcript_26593:731-1126(-)